MLVPCLDLHGPHRKCLHVEGHCPRYIYNEERIMELVEAAALIANKPCLLTGWGQDGPFHDKATCSPCIAKDALRPSPPQEGEA